MTTFEELGEAFIAKAVREFYTQAFLDPIIGHFFFKHDHETLIQKQTVFACLMLGSTKHSYTGKPLQKAHEALPLRNAHFNRRQKLMEEVLTAMHCPPHLQKNWLGLEEKLRPLIVNAPQKACAE